MANKSGQTVIVIGRNYSNGLAVARSLGAAGYEIKYIASSASEGVNDIAKLSKYVNEFREIVSVKLKEDKDDPELISAIIEYAGKKEPKPVLFPTDDYTTSLIDNHRDALEEYFLMPGIKDGGQGSLSTLMDKTVQIAMAKELGLNVPFTCTISLRDEEIVIPEDIPYPCFVKPVRSIEGYKTEMSVCEDSEMLMEKLTRMQNRFADRDVIIQEYLEIEQEYASAGVCIDQEVILPAFIRKTRVGQHSRGVTLTGELVPFEALGEDVCAKAIKLLKAFHYTGNFGMEFNVVNGEIYFNEVNLRSAGESYAYFKSGVNLPEIFVKAVADPGYRVGDIHFFGIGKTMLYDKIAWEDYSYGFIDINELDECLDSADIEILCDPDDPEPGYALMERYEQRYEQRHAEQAEKEKTRFRIERSRRCREAAAEALGCSVEEAREQVNNARELTGITFADYLKHKFWEVPPEDQVEVYKEIQEKREKELIRRENEMPLVVVMSRIYSTGLAITRSLGSAGYTVDYIGNCHKEGKSEIAAASKYIRKSVEVVSKKVDGGGDRALMKALMEYKKERRPGKRIVLFPTDDYTASVMDANRDKLSKIFNMPYITDGVEGTMLKKMSKTAQSHMARRAGLNVPKEWIISLRDEEITLPDDLTYPCFVKPMESITGYKKDMKKCDDRDMLLRHLTILQYRFSDRDILVQQFIDIDYEIDMSGVSMHGDVIIPGIIRKTMVAQHERGVTLAGVVEPYEELDKIDKGLRESLARLMKYFRYNGMFDLELNVSHGKVYFNEVNLRSGGPNYSYFMSGANLPAVTVRGLLNQSYDPETARVKEFGKSFIYEKVAWDDYAAGFINKFELNKLLKNADIRLIESKEDPVPTEMFNEQTRTAAEKKRRRRIKENLKKKVRKTGEDTFGDLWLAARGFPQGFKKNQRDPHSANPRVLIAGRNWCSNLSMAKSIAEGGYEPEVLRVMQRKPKNNNLLKWLRPEMKSKYVKAFYLRNTNRNRLKLVDYLKNLADPDRKMLLIPADDLVAYTIDEFYEELTDYYLMPSINNRGGGVVRLMNKDIQKQLAREAGLPVLNSCVITSKDKVVNIPDTVTYPCFIKPNISRNSAKSAMKKCDSKEELQAELEERMDRGFELLVEDFVEIKRELSYLGLSTQEGVVCPGYFEAVEEGEGTHRGVAMLGRLLPAEDAEPLMSQVVKFIESLKFNGLFDVDLIETVDGKVYFVELNMRYGASGYALTKGGANLPAMFADYMFNGTPVDLNCSINNAGQTFASEKVLIDEYREGLIEMEDVNRIMEEADIHFISDEADPKPYAHIKKHYATAKRLREESARIAAEKEAAEKALEDDE